MNLKQLKSKYWFKGLKIGLIIGGALFFAGFLDGLAGIVWPFSGGLVCNLLQGGSGESCAFTFLFFGWLVLPPIYGIIGLIIGALIGKVKAKK